MATVTLTVVHDEMEADVICGMLRAEGIDCFHRKANIAGAWTVGFATGGPIDVLVGDADLDRARELLASSDET